MAMHPDVGVRYSGAIVPLYDLIERLREFDMKPVLIPGPTPDVTVGVATVHLGDVGRRLLEEVLDSWGSVWSDVTASLCPLPTWHPDSPPPSWIPLGG